MPKTGWALRRYSGVLTLFGIFLGCFISTASLSAQCGTMVCNNVLQISIDENCTINFTPDLLLEGDPATQGLSFTLTIDDLGIINETLPFSENIPIGTYDYKVSNQCGNSCWGSFFAEDNIGPRLIGDATCPKTEPCRFSCNELQTILNSSDLTTSINPDFTEYCAGDLDVQFSDTFIEANGNCGIDTIKREWFALVNRHGDMINAVITTQYLVFDPVDLDDVWMPEGTVTVPCKVGEDPDSIATYLDDPWTCEHEGIAKSFPHILGNPIFCDQCKPIEIHFNFLKELQEDVPILIDGQWVLIDQWIKGTDSRSICGCDEWNSLQDEVKTTYSGIGDIVEILSPFPGATDADGKCTAWPSTSHFVATDTGSGTGVLTGSGTGVLPDPIASANHIPLYGNNHTCNLLTTKEDLIIPICADGDDIYTYKIVRTWKVFDWCTGQTKQSVQIIELEDLEGPSFTVIDSISLSTDPWLCGVNLEVPPPTDVTDECSKDRFNYTVAIDGYPSATIRGDDTDGYTVIGIPKGDHDLIYTVSDKCGNSTQDTTTIWIKDNVPPVAIAKENIVVSLTNSGSNAGVAKVFYNSIDNGSYDLCSDVKIEIRRDSDLCGIIGNDTYTSGRNQGDLNFETHPDSTQLVDPDGGDFVKFCCADLTEGHYGIHKVWMRVWDDANMDGVPGTPGDNYNLVWANVRVESKLNIAITCPPDITINCDVALDSLSVLGTPDVSSLCNITLDYEDDIPGTHCITGTVERKWFADKDNDSNADSDERFCKQTIEITDPRPMFCSDIVYPRDTTVNCANASMDSAPVWPEDRCGLFGYSEESEVFEVDDDYCYKIIRRFTVIDWCQYNPNISATHGVCTGTQKITVEDNNAPTFENCEDKIVESADGECMVADFSVTQTAIDEGDCRDKTLKWVICLDLGDNNRCDYTYTAITQSGEELDLDLVDDEGNALQLISGTHEITWTVTDACDNDSSCSTKLIIADDKNPTPICIEAISTAVMSNNGSVEIWATDFDPNKKSFDNCDNSLTYSFSGEEIISNLLISCKPTPDTIGNIKDGLFIDDGVSQMFQLPMWVWDDGYDVNCDGTVSIDERNKDWCTVTLRVDDNVDACPDTGGTSSALISGDVQTDEGAMVENVEVMISSSHPEYPSMMITANTGTYAFTSNPMNADYEISAERDDDYMNGVSTLDLVLMQKHILGLDILDSPYKVIASDINNDQRVSGSDLVELRKLILGIYAELPSNNSWRFVEEAQVFQNANSPFPFTEQIDIYNLSGNMSSQDFVGVKIGDVNGNVVANSFMNTEVRSSSKIILNAEQQSVQKGERIEIEFSSTDFEEVYGMQFTLEHTGLRLLDAVGAEINITDENIAVLKEGVLSSLSWSDVTAVSSDDVLFTLVFQAEQDVDLSNTISINSKVTDAEAYTTESYLLNDISLNFNNVEEAGEFVLFQNEPNPFANATSIGFSLPSASEVTLKVFDVTGKLVLKKQDSYPKGLSTIELNSDDLSSTGILYYQLDAGKYSATRKMVMIR